MAIITRMNRAERRSRKHIICNCDFVVLKKRRRDTEMQCVSSFVNPNVDLAKVRWR